MTRPGNLSLRWEGGRCLAQVSAMAQALLFAGRPSGLSAREQKVQLRKVAGSQLEAVQHFPGSSGHYGPTLLHTVSSVHRRFPSLRVSSLRRICIYSQVCI